MRLYFILILLSIKSFSQEPKFQNKNTNVSEGEDYYKQGEIAQSYHHLDTALYFYDLAIKSNISNITPKYNYARGYVYFILNNYKAALADMIIAYNNNYINSGETIFYIGLSRFFIGSNDDKRDELSVLSLSPATNFIEGQKYLREALKLNQIHRKEIYLFIALCDYYKKEYDVTNYSWILPKQIIANIDLSLEIDKEYHYAYYWKSRIFYDLMDDKSSALVNINKALSICPKENSYLQLKNKILNGL